MAKRNQLPYVVECEPRGQAFYEPIAAFNVDRIAINYATDCVENCAGNGYHYRVVDTSKRSRPLLYSTEVEVSRFAYKDVTKAFPKINVFLDGSLVGAIKKSGTMFYYLPKGCSERRGEQGQSFHSLDAVKRSLEAA